jgi:hypothetical protein
MKPRFASACAFGLALSASQSGCGSDGYLQGVGDVGTYDSDAGEFQSGDSSGSRGALDAAIQRNGVTVTVVTLGCSDGCASVEAIASGGNPPYSFRWENGSASAARDVCPTADTSYRVTVTDTAVTGEFSRAATTSQASLTADVLTCPDAGGVACADSGPGFARPASGHYVGTATCPPEGGVISVPSADGGEANSGTVSFDLAIDGSTVGGSLYFLWSLGAIAYRASLEGTVDCSQEAVLATWENTQWGLPATAPDGGMSLTPTGTGTGHITVAPVSGAPGQVEGAFVFDYADGFCHGQYTAALRP